MDRQGLLLRSDIGPFSDEHRGRSRSTWMCYTQKRILGTAMVQVQLVGVVDSFHNLNGSRIDQPVLEESVVVSQVNEQIGKLPSSIYLSCSFVSSVDVIVYHMNTLTVGFPLTDLQSELLHG
jgi:hypothetical protein